MKKTITLTLCTIIIGFVAKAQPNLVDTTEASVPDAGKITSSTKLAKASKAKKTYKIEFHGNGSTSGTTYRQTMTYGKSARLKACKFTCKGHTFKGWAKTRKGTVVYKDCQKVKNLSAKGKTVKLYAIWSKKSSTVSGAWSGKSGSYQVKTTMRLWESDGDIWGYLVWPGGDTRDVSGYRVGASVYLDIEGGDYWELTCSGGKMTGKGYKYGTSRVYKLSFSK